MAEHITHTDESEEELETFNVDDYEKLLEILKIKLPKGVLTPAAIARSTHTKVIADAELIKQALKRCELRVAPIPRLACGKIEQALQLQEENEIQAITEMIFFRDAEDSENETLKQRWENSRQPRSGFRIRKSYQESSPGEGGGASGFWYLNYDENQRNIMESFQFYLAQKGLTEEDVNCKKNGKLDFGFFSGKLDFLVEIKRSPDDSRPTEKIIIKCKSTERSMAARIFTQPQEGSQAEFNPSHQLYLQTQAYLFMLKEKEREMIEANRVPVSAVMVIKVKPDSFYWGEVSDDIRRLEQLNNFCKTEALPRFLAVLHLIFEKE